MFKEGSFFGGGRPWCLFAVSEVANLPLTTKKGRLLDYQTRDPKKGAGRPLFFNPGKPTNNPHPSSRDVGYVQRLGFAWGNMGVSTKMDGL